MPTYHVTLDTHEVDAMLLRAPHQIAMALIRGMAQVGPRYLEAATHYPPERPGQRYVRTGRLGMSWTWKVRRTAEGVVGELTSSPPGGFGSSWYARWVMDRNFQAWMHLGRWQTVQGIEETERDGTRQTILAALRSIG